MPWRFYMIKVDGITKRFGELTAVDSISFEVERGEIVGLLGPNGAGKTTTMRMITGYYAPEAGTIEIDGINMADEPIAAKKRVGYLPENAPLYEEMTVEEYLNFIADVKGIPNRSAVLPGILEGTGLTKVYNRFIWELSKGYHQRVGIAQTLLGDPDFLVMDEPTTGLDPNQIIEIRNLIRELGKTKTIMISTHILQEAEALSTKIMIIDKARIVARGSKDELKSILESKETLYVTARRNDAFFEGVKKIPGVLEMQRVSSGENTETYKILSKGNISEAVFREAVNRNAVLSELRSEKVSLEDVFIQLTRKEN